VGITSSSVQSAIQTPLAGAGWAGGHHAVRDAVELAAGALEAPPAVVLLFPDAGLAPGEVLAQARAAAPGARLAGMSSDGLVTEAGVRYGGCSALALASEIAVGVGLAEDGARDLAAAGRLAAERATAGLDLPAGRSVVLLFLDPTAGDGGEAVGGAYDVVGGMVPLAGGGANGRRPVVYADAAGTADGVVAVALASPAPVGVGISHGCRPRAATALVTRTEGREVRELDGRPAEDVYLEGIGHGGAHLDDETFEALAVRHPLAQPELRGDVRLRHVHGRTPDGALACATHLAANAAVWFAEQTERTIVESAEEAVAQALAPLTGPPRAVLAFDCAARKRALGHRLAEEADALVRALGDAPPPLAGLYTRGEVGRRRGARGDLNHAVVVVGLG